MESVHLQVFTTTTSTRMHASVSAAERWGCSGVQSNCTAAETRRGLVTPYRNLQTVPASGHKHYTIITESVIQLEREGPSNLQFKYSVESFSQSRLYSLFYQNY